MNQQFEYIDVHPHIKRYFKRTGKALLHGEGNTITPVAPCIRCGRYTAAIKVLRGPPSRVEDKEPLCEACQVVDTIEARLGFSEADKERLQAIRSLIENPDRVLRVERLHDKVDGIERRVDEKTEGLRQAMEAKLEGANTRVHNSALVVNVTLALGGFLAGVVVTLLLS